MAARYTVRPNRSGSFEVVQSRAGRTVVIGSECSHQRNADLKAARLNGEIDRGDCDWQRFYGAIVAPTDPQPGDRFEIPSGMGGIFTIRLLALAPDGTWQVRVDTPRNPDWHGYLIDGVRTDQLLPVRT